MIVSHKDRVCKMELKFLYGHRQLDGVIGRHDGEETILRRLSFDLTPAYFLGHVN